MTAPLAVLTPDARRIGGLDLSLTSTGIAVITRHGDDTCHATVATVVSKGRAKETLEQRLTRVVTVRQEIISHVAGWEAAMIENPSFGSKGGKPVDRNGLWWTVAEELDDLNIPTATCPPATLKKWATGRARVNGVSVDKVAVASALAELWPDVVLANGDQSDALAACTALAQRLGWLKVSSARRAVLKCMEWPPELPELEAAA